MSAVQQMLACGGPSRVGSVQVQSPGQYWSISGVSFSGGGGSGAAATANTYVNGTYGQNTWGIGDSAYAPLLIGYDGTTLPTGYTTSPTPLGSWITQPTITYSFGDLYEMTGNATLFSYSGAIAPDGVYTVSLLDSEYGIQSGSVTITIAAGAVTNTVINNPGLSTGQYWGYHYYGYWTNISVVVSGMQVSSRRGTYMTYRNGSKANSGSEYFSRVGGDHTEYASRNSVGLPIQQLTYQQNLYGVSTITVTSQGQNYSSPPTAQISGSVYGSAATLKSILI